MIKYAYIEGREEYTDDILKWSKRVGSKFRDIYNKPYKVLMCTICPGRAQSFLTIRCCYVNGKLESYRVRNQTTAIIYAWTYDECASQIPRPHVGSQYSSVETSFFCEWWTVHPDISLPRRITLVYSRLGRRYVMPDEHLGIVVDPDLDTRDTHILSSMLRIESSLKSS